MSEPVFIGWIEGDLFVFLKPPLLLLRLSTITVEGLRDEHKKNLLPN
jgi:hypothetical protein